MEDDKKLVREVLAEFFESQTGGYKAVAEKIGLSDQTLYNIIGGRENMAKTETILLINKHYPKDFAPYIAKIFGIDSLPSIKESMSELSLHAPGLPVDEQIELIRLRAESQQKDLRLGEKDDRIRELEDLVEYLKQDKAQTLTAFTGGKWNADRPAAKRHRSQATEKSFTKASSVPHALVLEDEDLAYTSDIKMALMMYGANRAQVGNC